MHRYECIGFQFVSILQCLLINVVCPCFADIKNKEQKSISIAVNILTPVTWHRAYMEVNKADMPHMYDGGAIQWNILLQI